MHEIFSLNFKISLGALWIPFLVRIVLKRCRRVMGCRYIRVWYENVEKRPWLVWPYWNGHVACCQTAWIQMRRRVTLHLIWIKAVGICYYNRGRAVNLLKKMISDVSISVLLSSEASYNIRMGKRMFTPLPHILDLDPNTLKASG